VVGAVASGINAVAGGGSLVSFPTLTFGLHLPTNIANATNSVSLWPGSLGGAFGFHNVFEKTKPYLRLLIIPTILGATAGAYLFTVTSPKVFDLVVPFLILLAAILLLVQPKVKALVTRGERVLHPRIGWFLQFIVAVYGGYFGAGMGIMMLAAFALYMDANIHEINAVKSWLGVVINLFASAVFVLKGGLIDWSIAAALGVGSIVGGFSAARFSQRIHPDTLRVMIAVYGVGMAAYYLYRAL
jgi:hypothetical protein